MLDDATVLSRLDSALYGALVHVSHLAARALDADLTAARVTGPQQRHLAHYVSGGRAGLTTPDEESLKAWVQDETAVFGLPRGRQLHDMVFRPREVLDELEYARLAPLRRIEPLCEVRDTICVTFCAGNNINCTIALLRCNESEPFDRTAHARLERLRPALARVVQRGVERENAPKGNSVKMTSEGLVRLPVSLAEMIGKLSGTELQVLNHLRDDTTEKEIAVYLGRSPHTVHVHVKNIYRKLGVTSRKHLLSLFKE